MKKSDTLWFQLIAQKVQKSAESRKSPIYGASLQSLQNYNHIVLDELCESLNHYTRLINDLTPAAGQEPMFRFFRLGGPLPGVLVLRGRDKLVVSGENTSVTIRILRIHAYGENNVAQFDFESRWNKSMQPTWWCTNYNQPANAELVVKDYLGGFFISGSSLYENANQNANRRTFPADPEGLSVSLP